MPHEERGGVVSRRQVLGGAVGALGASFLAAGGTNASGAAGEHDDADSEDLVGTIAKSLGAAGFVLDVHDGGSSVLIRTNTATRATDTWGQGKQVAAFNVGDEVAVKYDPADIVAAGAPIEALQVTPAVLGEFSDLNRAD